MKMAAMWRRTRISEGSAFAVLIVAAFASATPPTNHRMDDLPTLLNKIKSSRSDRTDPKFDCAWRRYAYEYAPQIMPRLHADPAKMKRLFDALELQALCQQNFSLASGGGLKTDTAADAQKPSHRGEEAPIEVYVDPVQGRDNNTGTSSAPLQTIAGAVAATRQRRKEIGDTAQIWLLGGVYHLPATIELGPQDSGLSITAVRGQHVVISGGRHITNVEWSHGTTPKGAAYVVTDLSAQDLPEGVPAMHYGDPTNRQRATRARFPNANPELDLFPAGYITEKVDWTLPTFDGVTCDSSKQCGKSVNLTFATPPSEWHGMYQNWTTGVGTCARRFTLVTSDGISFRRCKYGCWNLSPRGCLRCLQSAPLAVVFRGLLSRAPVSGNAHATSIRSKSGSHAAPRAVCRCRRSHCARLATGALVLVDVRSRRRGRSDTTRHHVAGIRRRKQHLQFGAQSGEKLFRGAVFGQVQHSQRVLGSMQRESNRMQRLDMAPP
eukprot:m.639081 g.639081  ORF g.639081 m.639081 type:complete len:493 (-) comp22611_c1_seq1:1772-3250(-)